ncbi:hypothetical protein N7539_008627 [Penicillium diatomitis]|uniref:ER-bound oxygenase mpaB/mpaB'/Rubber oxygenase catalytic domain-containing protein n=1 Tax=Penicillium diatomitis TaxID=2819901 RepID=A0A9X0BM42_9EURO|nr:uncharacterized protein N7539_008627 [Penicillium diatomitis]KAJ5472058.1 hypothetical protein N7539_008627 [Penicillium diatomitis]
MSTLKSQYEQIVSKSICLMDGGLALMMQIARSQVAAAVAIHSRFEKNAQQRAISSLEYINIVLLGEDEEIGDICERVRRIHDGVQGAEGDESYSTSDSELQNWVAGTIYWG